MEASEDQWSWQSVRSWKSEVRVGSYQSEVLSCTVGCCYQAMSSEDTADQEDFVCAVVIYKVCRLVVL
jgi:hypothetical protein